jgi:hypothetical protein
MQLVLFHETVSLPTPDDEPKTRTAAEYRWINPEHVVAVQPRQWRNGGVRPGAEIFTVRGTWTVDESPAEVTEALEAGVS